MTIRDAMMESWRNAGVSDTDAAAVVEWMAEQKAAGDIVRLLDQPWADASDRLQRDLLIAGRRIVVAWMRKRRPGHPAFYEFGLRVLAEMRL